MIVDGPPNKSVTFVHVENAALNAAPFARTPFEATLEWAAHHTPQTVLEAQLRACQTTFSAAGVPWRQLSVADLDEASLGALAMHCLLETLLMGRLMGVDPFDQPAVDRNKRIIHQELAQPR